MQNPYMAGTWHNGFHPYAGYGYGGHPYAGFGAYTGFGDLPAANYYGYHARVPSPRRKEPKVVDIAFGKRTTTAKPKLSYSKTVDVSKSLDLSPKSTPAKPESPK